MTTAQKRPAEQTMEISERDRLLKVYEKQAGLTAGSYIQCTEGPLRGKQFLLPDSTLAIGRNRDCNVVINDPAVSGHHATIFRRQEAYFIRDEQSTNGTFVNDQQIETVTLAFGDRIRLGQSVWKVMVAKPNEAR